MTHPPASMEQATVLPLSLATNPMDLDLRTLYIMVVDQSSIWAAFDTYPQETVHSPP